MDLFQSLFILEDRYVVMKTLTKQESQTQQEEEIEAIPICASNLSSPVIDRTQFISEIHYKIGNRLYIENAD